MAAYEDDFDSLETERVNVPIRSYWNVPIKSARLYRTDVTDCMIGGVCGGLGEYLDIDPTLIRLVTVGLAFLSGGGAILVYIIAKFIIPSEIDA